MGGGGAGSACDTATPRKPHGLRRPGAPPGRAHLHELPRGPVPDDGEPPSAPRGTRTRGGPTPAREATAWRPPATWACVLGNTGRRSLPMGTEPTFGAPGTGLTGRVPRV